mmetsp:Transcript_78296/g.227083  ORF Transcript_78296/g.227083 Transcript_78296/m.227083 type:complete len:242 (-) Transcript_78296:138-863(-)
MHDPRLARRRTVQQQLGLGIDEVVDVVLLVEAYLVVTRAIKPLGCQHLATSAAAVDPIAELVATEEVCLPRVYQATRPRYHRHSELVPRKAAVRHILVLHAEPIVDTEVDGVPAAIEVRARQRLRQVVLADEHRVVARLAHSLVPRRDVRREVLAVQRLRRLVEGLPRGKTGPGRRTPRRGRVRRSEARPLLREPPQVGHPKLRLFGVEAGPIPTPLVRKDQQHVGALARPQRHYRRPGSE